MSENPNDYYFAVDDDSFVIMKKSFWDKYHYFDDSGYAPPFLEKAGFLQLTESVYEFSGNMEKGREILKNLGLEENKNMLKW